MSAAPPEPTAPAVETERAPAPDPRPRRWGRWVALGLVVLVALLALLAGGARLMVRTEAGRSLVANLLEGLPLGPVGRLHVEGIGGDPLSDLTLARLQIVDARGPWLDARDLELRWRWSELLSRRFHARSITAGTLTLVRDPVLAPQPPSRGASRLPIAVQIDALRLRLDMLPAFSVRPGSYRLDSRFSLERNMAAAGRLSARSLLRSGDGLSAVFQVGQGGRVLIRADAVEGRGGALAGGLGLPVTQALSVSLRADGTVDSGALQLRATSGADMPLSADSNWGAGGARLAARLELGASRLTHDLAVRAGPLAQLTLAARHLHGDVFDVQGLLAAQTASLRIAGPLDWKVRSTSGLALTLDVPDAARWAPGVAIASARLGGSVTGDPERFDFKGRLAAARLAQSGYSLARADGPVALSRQGEEWRVQADLAGAGGAGQGLVAGLLGPAPRVKLDGTRLADGRLLVRSLDAAGAGVSVTGQGGQALLGGGLSFKGQAQLASLGTLQTGLHGRLDAAWTADRAKGAEDWRFDLDAHAGGFATGSAPADHFLGSAPRLKASARWGPAGLQVASAALTGAAVQVTASGRLDPKGPLAFGLGWQAQGPFEAGPLKVAGEAKGTGRISGTLGAPAVELDSRIASLALGRLIVAPANLTLAIAKDGPALGGRVQLAGPSGYGPASLKAAFRLADGAVEVNDLDADAGGVKATGALTLQGGAPGTADLVLQVRRGAFLDAGHLDGTVRLSQTANGLAAHLVLDGGGIAAPGLQGVLHGVRLRADGPYDHLPVQIAADSLAPTPWRFSGSGRLDQAGTARTLTLGGSGEVRKITLKTLRPAVLRLDGDTRQLDLGLAVGGGRVEVSAHQSGQAMGGVAHLSEVNLSAFDTDYEGAVNATLNLDGRGASLAGALDATLAGARSRDAPADLALDSHVHAELAGERLRLVAAATNAQGLKSNLQVDLPAVASAAPFRVAVDRTRPMRGDFSAEGELRPLWDLLVGGDQRLSGRVSTQGTLAGTLNAPKVLGHAAIAAGRYQNYAVGLDLQKFAVNADFGQDAVRISELQGTDGRNGTLAGSGDIGLAQGGGSTFALKLNHFRVIDTDSVTATMSGDATVTRDARGQAKLVGALKVDRADISPNAPTPSGAVAMEVMEINKPGEPEVQTTATVAKPAMAPPLALDVTVRSSRGVFVKGKGLNVELSLDAHVTGSASAPDLSGEARVVLGSYDFAGKRFDFDGRSLIRLGVRPEDIRLNLIATRQNTTFSTTSVESKPTSATTETSTTSAPSANAGLTAEVHVTGTAARPDITLTSTPVLPQDEILSQVLFGSSAAQLTGAQAAELASTLASLSGGGGFDVLGRLRQFSGLDRLAFGQGTSGTGVSGGKYVTDSVYIELTGGGREGPSAAVEWRVRRNFSVISQVGTQGDAQLSIQYNRTFR
ncbi:translocation/assembly module TamB domain-containing protein [Caulobacter sp. S45]|uniref:translocation/assembly module TamB domain-containing protein n=1 Tax=Caulobacter sp. S45 TaxID=1641861 RepID=UPI00157652EE|nr:translocation/assembly module TamB domain-containing protein [Caulobacter sp. S45]